LAGTVPGQETSIARRGLLGRTRFRGYPTYTLRYVVPVREPVPGSRTGRARWSAMPLGEVDWAGSRDRDGKTSGRRWAEMPLWLETVRLLEAG